MSNQLPEELKPNLQWKEDLLKVRHMVKGLVKCLKPPKNDELEQRVINLLEGSVNRFIAQAHQSGIEQGRSEEGKKAEKEIRYYAERLQYDRKQGFSEFVAILQSVLLPKTDARLISAIIEDVIIEWNKIYAPKTPKALSSK